MLSSSEKEKIKKFKKKHKKMLNDPLRKSFLNIPENNNLFEKVILSNFDSEMLEKFEEAFKEHYERVKKYTYFSNLIKQFAIDFDKRYRKNKSRIHLVLDQSTNQDENSTLKDVLTMPNEKEPIDVYVENEIVDVELFKAVNNLSKKQIQIIELCIFEGMSTNEVSTLLNTTPQNVSNLKRKAINNLKKELTEKGGYFARN
ncbi:MAG: sigma-70 family RNA polymerase sigma factor [Enterococcus faecalis]